MFWGLGGLSKKLGRGRGSHFQSLRGEAGMDAESWVGRNLSSGGQYFVDGAEVRLYGTEGNRTLDIVARAPPVSRIPETTTNQSSRTGEETTNRRP